MQLRDVVEGRGREAGKMYLPSVSQTSTLPSGLNVHPLWSEGLFVVCSEEIVCSRGNRGTAHSGCFVSFVRFHPLERLS